MCSIEPLEAGDTCEQACIACVWQGCRACGNPRVCVRLVCCVGVQPARRGLCQSNSFSLCHAGCVGRSHRYAMCVAGCCPACCHCACMCVWLVCGVVDGSPGDAPICAQIGLLDAGGVVSQACIAYECRWCAAGVVACCACLYALCGPFVGAAPSCRLLEPGAPWRPSQGAPSFFPRVLALPYQVLCTRGLP